MFFHQLFLGRDSLSSNISHPDLDTAVRDFTSNRRIWRSQFSPFIRPSLDIKIDEEHAAKKYYMLPVIGTYSVKISFDRLALLALLDRYGDSKLYKSMGVRPHC